MLSPSLFWLDRISPDNDRSAFDSNRWRAALPQDEIERYGGRCRFEALPAIPFRFPAHGNRENAVDPIGLRIPLPAVHCTGVWILASCECGEYVGTALVRHANGRGEKVPIVISSETASGPSPNETLLLTVSHYHTRVPTRDFPTLTPVKLYAQRIPIREQGPVSSIELSPAGASPTLYAVTIEHASHIARTCLVQARVVGPRGHSVEGAKVCLGPYVSSTDGAGHFRLMDVVPGRYELGIGRLGYYPIRGTYDIGDDGVVGLDIPVMQSSLIPFVQTSGTVLKVGLVLWTFLLTIEVIAMGLRRWLLRTNERSPWWVAKIPVASRPFQKILDIASGETAGYVAQLFGITICVAAIACLS